MSSNFDPFPPDSHRFPANFQLNLPKFPNISNQFHPSIDPNFPSNRLKSPQIASNRLKSPQIASISVNFHQSIKPESILKLPAVAMTTIPPHPPAQTTPTWNHSTRFLIHLWIYFFINFLSNPKLDPKKTNWNQWKTDGDRRHPHDSGCITFWSNCGGGFFRLFRLFRLLAKAARRQRWECRATSKHIAMKYCQTANQSAGNGFKTSRRWRRRKEEEGGGGGGGGGGGSADNWCGHRKVAV